MTFPSPSTPSSNQPAPGSVSWVMRVLQVLAVLVAGYGLYVYGWILASTGKSLAPLQNAETHRVWLVLHASAGGLALLCLVPQLTAFRKGGSARGHVAWGYAYAILVLISGLAGLRMAPHAEGGLWARFGFGVLAVLWLATTACAVGAAIKGNLPGHRRGMERSAALACAAISLRLQMPLYQLLGLSFALYYPIVSWSCWVPNLLWVEGRRLWR